MRPFFAGNIISLVGNKIPSARSHLSCSRSFVFHANNFWRFQWQVSNGTVSVSFHIMKNSRLTTHQSQNPMKSMSESPKSHLTTSAHPPIASTMSSSTSPSCGTRHLRQGWQLKQTEVGKCFDGGPNTGAPAVSPQNVCLWCVDCIPMWWCQSKFFCMSWSYRSTCMFLPCVSPYVLYSTSVREDSYTLSAKALSARTEIILTHTQRKNAYYFFMFPSLPPTLGFSNVIWPCVMSSHLSWNKQFVVR